MVLLIQDQHQIHLLLILILMNLIQIQIQIIYFKNQLTLEQVNHFMVIWVEKKENPKKENPKGPREEECLEEDKYLEKL